VNKSRLNEKRTRCIRRSFAKLGRNSIHVTHLATLDVQFAYDLMVPAGGSRSCALPDQTQL
jgi:hypothetical protein